MTTTAPAAFTFPRPAWATKVTENIDNTITFSHVGGIEVRSDDYQAATAPLELQQMLQLTLSDDESEVTVSVEDEGPVISIDQVSLTVDEACTLVEALTELIEHYDAAMGGKA